MNFSYTEYFAVLMKDGNFCHVGFKSLNYDEVEEWCDKENPTVSGSCEYRIVAVEKHEKGEFW